MPAEELPRFAWMEGPSAASLLKGSISQLIVWLSGTAHLHVGGPGFIYRTPKRKQLLISFGANSEFV